MNDNKRRDYWFKRRRYGYGWTPVTWQGWLTVLLFLVMILSGALALKDVAKNTFPPEAVTYLVLLMFATVFLVTISYLKGPRPKWRWGRKSTDNPNEDI